MAVSVWEAIFMLVVLKLPVIYLAVVVWWAVRAEPETRGDGDGIGVLSPLTPCGWDDWKKRRARGSRRRPSARPPRLPLAARVRTS